jgi:hypothetical protein
LLSKAFLHKTNFLAPLISDQTHQTLGTEK